MGYGVLCAWYDNLTLDVSSCTQATPGDGIAMTGLALDTEPAFCSLPKPHGQRSPDGVPWGRRL
jgi:hypothetical protein